jgi:hypothetical protein
VARFGAAYGAAPSTASQCCVHTDPSAKSEECEINFLGRKKQPFLTTSEVISYKDTAGLPELQQHIP